MARLPDTPMTMSPSLESGPELGSPSLMQQYNKKTGRPIRRSAGRAKSLAGFVDSAVIEDDDDEPIELPSEDEDGEPIKRIKKRKRTPSPSPPPLEDIIYEEPLNESSDDESIGDRKVDESPITLQFNIPLGFHGPLVVKLDRSLLNNSKHVAHDMHPRKARRKLQAATTEAESKEKAVAVKKTGFCDLPPELRNKVYRHVLVVEGGFHFPGAKNFCRSAQFLRTCRLVHSEGCSILYGENNFSFDRNRTTRGTLFDRVPKEIGYREIRQFLNMIGPENLAFLRDVQLILEDANPASTPYLDSQEERRYLNDDQLSDCLRILRQAKLRKFALMFLGRRALAMTDCKFLDRLERIKADEVKEGRPHHYYPSKIHTHVWDRLKEQMTRKKKLYAPE